MRMYNCIILTMRALKMNNKIRHNIRVAKRVYLTLIKYDLNYLPKPKHCTIPSSDKYLSRYDCIDYLKINNEDNKNE